MGPAERSLRDGLQRVRRRWFRAVVLSRAWRIVICAALALGSAALVERFSHPEGALLRATCGVVLFAIVSCGVVFAWPYRRRPDDRRVARFIEERWPECEDEIVAAVDIARSATPSTFAALVVERAAGRLHGLDPGRIVSRRELRVGVFRVGAAAAALIVAGVLALPLFMRATLEARGSTRAIVPPAGIAARSTPPRVQAIDLHYEYPRFTALAPRDERDGGDIYAPAGTRVRLRVRADKPISTARVALGSSVLPASRVDARTFESTMTLSSDGAYRASVQDAEGLRGESVEYFIRLVTDRPPEVHIVRPAGDQEITPLEEVSIQAKADDDFGIASMDMVFAVAGGPEHVVAFQSVVGSATERTGTRLLSAEELGVKPGDVISYYARARDVAHAKAPTLSHSEIYFLEVKPFDEAYSLADSQAMAAATGTELAGLIAAQKAVISATWNLQRRGHAGSSPGDVQAVEIAQAELKARAERAAGTERPIRRGFGGAFFQFVREPRQTGGGDNVAEAAAAMGRAVEQLHTGSTRDAISPEMTALASLLKAEAEIRQRQITQQRGGTTSFGNGRQGQDLSNLFDRELKRQQRTDYEAGSRPEEQPSSQQPSALDRIGELARREADLAREMESSTVPEAERRREFERLAREQEELRRQLERASEQGASTAARQAAGGSQKDAEAAMRHALQRMRDASSDLQRRDAASAARRAAAAADQLRDAQAKLQSGDRDRGAAAESRKLADALDTLRRTRNELASTQRRLADLERAAAGRGEKGSRGNDELQRARQEYARAVQRAEKSLGAMPQGDRDTSGAASTPERHEWSWGAPGTESWKQDFSKWETLGHDIGRALERSESLVAQRLSKALARDRIRAGASERVPNAYADRVARYYESLAGAIKRQ